MQQQLGSVADVVNHSVPSTTLRRRRNIWGELEGFLATEGRSADEAIPEEICRFIDSYERTTSMSTAEQPYQTGAL